MASRRPRGLVATLLVAFFGGRVLSGARTVIECQRPRPLMMPSLIMEYKVPAIYYNGAFDIVRSGIDSIARLHV